MPLLIACLVGEADQRGDRQMDEDADQGANEEYAVAVEDGHPQAD